MFVCAFICAPLREEQNTQGMRITFLRGTSLNIMSLTCSMLLISIDIIGVINMHFFET